jgi:hypothetical protein
MNLKNVSTIAYDVKINQTIHLVLSPEADTCGLFLRRAGVITLATVAVAADEPAYRANGATWAARAYAFAYTG